MNNDLTTLTDRITNSLKPKFKVGQQVVCVMSKENVTKDNVYVVEESYVCASNIPCVVVIGDDGEMFRYYQTYFKAADMSKFDVKMSVEEAKVAIKWGVREFFCMCEHDDSKGFIEAIQHDKELQKALLVLIGGDK